MEFHEKLQELRKNRQLTQEDLANALFVSRTAISKWESGRGFPNIDSLKALSKYFEVSLDDLLSGEELLTIAEEDHKEKQTHLRDSVFGLLDISMVLLMVLPLFGQAQDNMVRDVSLPALTAVQPYLKGLYIAFVLSCVVYGIITLALQTCRRPFWLKHKHTASTVLTTACILLFILSKQPYAAVFALFLLLVKVFLLIKQR